MTDSALDPSERQCLRFLAGLEPPSGRCCDDETIQRLVRRRLIEPVVTQYLPLEMRRFAYRLTLLGRAALDRRPGG